MIIATYNVNSVRSRLHIILPWIMESMPDIICMQETKVIDDEFPEAEFISLGYNVVHFGEKSYNGVAIASRHPIDDVSFGFDGAGKEDGPRLLMANICSLSIVNTYIPQGTDPKSSKFLYKIDWFGRLKKLFMEKYSTMERLVWLGDFNVAPDSIDVHSPEKLLGSVGFHPDEHRVLAEVKALGFVDVFRMHCEGSGHYSFWDYRVKDGFKRGVGWRVDHIWASQDIASISKRSWIDKGLREKEKPSDHAPLLAEFDIC
jgi:exodeoxyribonuclease-3